MTGGSWLTSARRGRERRDPPPRKTTINKFGGVGWAAPWAEEEGIGCVAAVG